MFDIELNSHHTWNLWSWILDMRLFVIEGALIGQSLVRLVILYGKGHFHFNQSEANLSRTIMWFLWHSWMFINSYNNPIFNDWIQQPIESVRIKPAWRGLSTAKVLLHYITKHTISFKDISTIFRLLFVRQSFFYSFRVIFHLQIPRISRVCSNFCFWYVGFK